MKYQRQEGHSIVYVPFNHRIYVMGGSILQEHEQKYLNHILDYEKNHLNRMSKVQSKDMNDIAQMSKDQCVQQCEYYDIDKDEWVEIAPLIDRQKIQASCCLFQDKYIYVIGGHYYYQESQLDRYNIQDNQWQSCDFIKKNDWIPALNSLTYQIDENKILIYAGENTLQSYVINLEDNVIEKVESEFKEEFEFFDPCPLMLDGKLYVMSTYDHERMVLQIDPIT